MEETVLLTQTYISSGTFAHLIGVNADKVLQARDNPHIAEIIERCEIVNADGASMVLASSWLGKPLPERVSGIDLLHHLCAAARDNGNPVYFLGAREEVVHKTRQVIENKFPGIVISGVRHGYFSESEYSTIAENIRKMSPSIVFVGITSPKKEELIEYFREKGLTSVFVGVGGSFDVISGQIPRAPRWLQRINMEWFFRMMQEPRRLFKRYLVGNTRFMLLVLRAKFGRKEGKS